MPSPSLDAPHHDGSRLYAGTDRPAVGDVVPVRLRVPRGAGIRDVWVRGTPDAEPKYYPARRDALDEHAQWWVADVAIRNPLTRYRWLVSGPGVPYGWVNGTGLHGHDVPDAHDFALSTYPGPPTWADDAVVYQVFPDRFARSAAAAGRDLPDWALSAAWDDPVVHRPPEVARQLYGGDLDGVVAHLDHLTALGVDTLYLTPVFPAASNHRYDAASFDRVDPLLGGDEALARLTAAAHHRGIRVVGDLTTNHTGRTHDWFLAAQADPHAPERDYYYFREDGSYEYWLEAPTLPKLRFGEQLRNRLLSGPDSVVGRWLRPPYALDGWRIDVANMTGRRADDDHNRDVALAIRSTMLEVAPDTLLIAEHCHDASGDLSGEGWHGAMNYAGFLRPVWGWLRSPEYQHEFLGLPVDVPRLAGGPTVEAMRAFAAVTPWRSLTSSWSLIGSHDTPRVRTVLGDPEAVHVAAGLLFTHAGTPMFFMGDEYGEQGVNGEDARRPMPWNAPERRDEVTFGRFRDLIALRRSTPALRTGGMRWVYADDEVIAYVRESRAERVLCLATRGAHPPVTLPLSTVGTVRDGANLYGGAPDLKPTDVTVELAADGPAFQAWRL